MLDAEWLAIDWGTTNRRIYAIGADGIVVSSERDDRGILSIAPDGYTAEVAAIRARFGDLPILCAGMVGSNRGWAELPYVPCQAGVEALAGAVRWVEPGRTAIVPGVTVAYGRRRDVMRGEEVQLLGAVASGLAPADALLCQPGTHCKWAWMADGRIDRFVTAMTGELYALIGKHSLLAAQMTGQATPGADFLGGVADAADGDLSARLFGVRADAVTGERAIGDAASYISGLLIGADVRQRLGAGDHAHVLADATLGGLYVAAIEAIGARATLIDSHAAFVAGISQVWSLIR
ncbi:2-oxo-3-deoxygalactonate kinase [Sphingomonas sp. Leaf33]|uniref:2-dehydro-3-deoxygalactonokinase n=1 Tax=Sphingomonas sp. Leaf33 TaxID=1736215 RepID=UPI0006F80C1F|nr:2-dehydro-3-deoxygalactonokinase [Sphingomonas sp. Leaf33]KQN25662.1 2-oxo-3-deoxygalactonate kinase [Sphingomonas sp. Leaf33]